MIKTFVPVLFLAAATLFGDQDAQAQIAGRPLRIYAITFRGMTDVERGFQDYFAARRIPVQITFRDLNRSLQVIGADIVHSRMVIFPQDAPLYLDKHGTPYTPEEFPLATAVRISGSKTPGVGQNSSAQVGQYSLSQPSRPRAWHGGPGEQSRRGNVFVSGATAIHWALLMTHPITLAGSGAV